MFPSTQADKYKIAPSVLVGNERSGGAPLTVWQRSYHDHIIRNPDDHNRIRVYILNNPACWEQDTFYDSQLTTRPPK